MKRLVLLFVLTISLASSIILGTASAITASDWKAGDIISDSVFFNKDDMSVNDIQSFLGSLVTSCDTWGTSMYDSSRTRAQVGTSQGNPPPYICVKDYYENPTTHETNFNSTATAPSGSISAAQIIYNVSQQFNINPKVLLVTLKKEAPLNLIEDDWPMLWEYQKSMGYGCPDTAPCDSQYFGFYNQMYNAARQFRLYANNPTSYRRQAGITSAIPYHPSNTSCASPNVYIENQATAGLYNYTPFQPNAAALANMPGTGDSCSAYGNRNFWYIWNKWFGSTKGNRWVSMLEPRIMLVSQDTLKVYADSMRLDDNWLNIGQQVLFASKTDLANGTVCLRTHGDTINNVPRCVLMPRLSEFVPTFTLIENEADKIRSTTKWTCKVSLRNTWALCDDVALSENTYVEFVATTEVGGIQYYITQHDWDNGKLKGLRVDKFRQAYKYQNITTEYYITNKFTHKYIPGTTIIKQDIIVNTIVPFASKVLVSGKEYYRSVADSNTNSNQVVPKDDLSEVFNPFLSPRYLRVNKSAVSKNLATGQVCATFTAGTVLFFDTKVNFNGITYYRDKDTTDRDEICAIDSKYLSEM